MNIGLTVLFSRDLPFDGEFVAMVARLAEDLGFESIWLPEHVVIPANYDSKYPYTREGLPGDDQWPDPLVCLTYAAAVTRKLKLGTCVAILPEHNPLELAKELATIDALAGGRVLYGIGSGWLKEECDALGIDWHTRGRRTDEAIEIMRKAWSEDAFSFEGRIFRFAAVKCSPKPQRRGIPIIYGGLSRVAARRAARLCDGFFPVGTPDELRNALQLLREECAAIGRNPAEIEVTCATANLPDFMDRDAKDWVAQIASLGADRVLVPLGYMNLSYDPDGLAKGLGAVAKALGL
jgi:probable F420-dependent oxidoreductase